MLCGFAVPDELMPCAFASLRETTLSEGGPYPSVFKTQKGDSPSWTSDSPALNHTHAPEPNSELLFLAQSPC